MICSLPKMARFGSRIRAILPLSYTAPSIHGQQPLSAPDCHSSVYHPARSVSTSPRYRHTVDPDEVKNFEQFAKQMWSENGEYELLHLMNWIRVPYIVDGMTESSRPKPLNGKQILDVGCGGGILSEPLARLGADVTGIDASVSSIEIAKSHAKLDPNLASKLEYICEDVTNLSGRKFDAVVASEVIEHVSSVDWFLQGCCGLIKPGGSLFITTINRTPLAYFLTIAMAENVLGIVPRGMHDYEKYVKPAELKEKLSGLGFSVSSCRGMFYNPVMKVWSWQEDESINYALHAVNMNIDFTDQDNQAQ